MTKNEVIKETINRLFTCRAASTQKTREEEWLESILRLLLGISEDQEILVDLNALNVNPKGTKQT